ncbi:MAG: DUF4157 domain-containing protein [Balneolales bacterium]
MQTAKSIQRKPGPEPIAAHANKRNGPQLKIADPNGIQEKEADKVADGFAMKGHGAGTEAIHMKPMSPAATMAVQQERPEFESMEIQTKTNLGTATGRPVAASVDLSKRIGKARDSGKPLDRQTGEHMAGFTGNDFSGVRVHTGRESAAMNDELHSRAFTVGDDIFFNRGEYRPDTAGGQHLIAHELTHTVQQGQGPNIAEKKIHMSRLRRIGSAIGNKVRGAREWAGDKLSDGLKWLRNKIGSMVTELPGYGLFTVFMGKDPVSGDQVDRNGLNFIEQGLEIIPNGREYREKLAAEGALEEAATWIDDQLAGLDLRPGEILTRFRNFWGSLGLSDVKNPGDVFDRLVAIFSGPINRLIRFAKNLALKFLEIVKNFLLSRLREYVVDRESPTWYPLLTVILGHDPIMDEEVDRSGEMILDGFIRLHPEGDEQLRQMKESGSYGRAVEWINSAVTRIQNIAGGLKTAFENAWAKVTDIHSLMDPIGTFAEIYSDFRTPINELIDFAGQVASSILTFIKDALLRRLSSFARNRPGYPLLTLIIGRDPFTHEAVDRSVENIIHGFMNLVPGGEEQFIKLRESGAIDRAASWIEGAIEDLDITWTYLKGLFTRAWDSFGLNDLARPIAAFERIVRLFIPPIQRLIRFVVVVVMKLIEIVLQIMRFPIDLIRSIFSRAAEAFESIKRDPVGFLRNLLSGVKLGFSQFFDHIRTHLLGGITDWLFGQLGDAGISPPKDLTFKSVFGLVLEILGVTAERIFEKIAERIGPENMERIKSAADQVSGAWAFVKEVVTRGPVAIWERVREKLSNLWDMVLTKVRDWVVVQVIEKAAKKLLSMLDPTGIMAIINSAIAFFNAVQSVIRYFTKILEMIDRFLEGVVNIAMGTLKPAADRLESALAGGLSIALGFLANQAGLGKIGARVGEIIESLRERVDRAIEWVIDKAVEAGSGLLEAGRSAAGRISNIWNRRETIKVDAANKHELYFKQRGGRQVLMLASNPSPLTGFLDAYEPGADSEKATAHQEAMRLSEKIDRLKESIEGGSAQPKAEEEISTSMKALIPVLQVIFGNRTRDANEDLPLYHEFLNKEVRTGELRSALDSQENKVAGHQVYVLYGDNQIRRGAGMAEKGYMKLKIENGFLLPDTESASKPTHSEFEPRNLTISNENDEAYKAEYTTGRLDGGEQTFTVKIRYMEVLKSGKGYMEKRNVAGDELIRKPKGVGRGRWDSAGNGFDNAHLIGDQFGGSGYNQSLNIYPSSPDYNRKVMKETEDALIGNIIEGVPFEMNVNAEIFHWFRAGEDKEVAEKTSNHLKEELQKISGVPSEADDTIQQELTRQLRSTIKADIEGMPGQFDKVSYKVEQDNKLADDEIGRDDNYEEAVKKRG